MERGELMGVGIDGVGAEGPEHKPIKEQLGMAGEWRHRGACVVDDFGGRRLGRCRCRRPWGRRHRVRWRWVCSCWRWSEGKGWR